MRLSERRLRTLFQTIVVGAAQASCTTTPDQPDADADASIADATDAANCVLCVDVTIDSYVDWCDAGAPTEVGNDGCYAYFYVPCGLPDTCFVTNPDSGVLNRCDQICKGVSSVDCVLTTNPYALFDAGEGGNDARAIDASDEASTDDGGNTPAVYVRCDCYNGGRRPVGLRKRAAKPQPALAAYFSELAHLEAASVTAFARLRKELARLGASPRLLARIARAQRDEERHARTTARVGRRFGAVVPRARVRKAARRSVYAIARENAVEGCVRETYGALVATWQAKHARDPRVRKLMATIARDETRHAAVSWACARFLESALDDRVRARLARERTESIVKLYAETGDAPPDVAGTVGLPAPSQARHLLDELRATIWAS